MRFASSFDSIKNSYIHVKLTLFILFLSSISAARADDRTPNMRGLVRTTIEKTDLKNEPSDDAKTVGTFQKTTQVEILDHNSTLFHRVEIDGIEGYLENGHSVKWEALYPVSTRAELKSAPQLSSKTIEILPQFSKVELLDGFQYVFRKVKFSASDATNSVYRKVNFKSIGYIPSHKLFSSAGELRVQDTTELLNQPDIKSSSVGLITKSNAIEFVDNYIYFNLKIQSGDKIEIQPQVVDANSILYRKVKVNETIGYLDHSSIDFARQFSGTRAVFSKKVQLKKTAHDDAKVLKEGVVFDKFRYLAPNNPDELYTKVRIGESVGYIPSKSIQWEIKEDKSRSRYKKESPKTTKDEKSDWSFNLMDNLFTTKEDHYFTTNAPCVIATAPLWGPYYLEFTSRGGRFGSEHYLLTGLCTASTIGTTIAVAGLDERNAQAIDFIAFNRETLRKELIRGRGEFLAAFFETVDIHAARRNELTARFAASQSFLFIDGNARSILRRMVMIADDKSAFVKSES